MDLAAEKKEAREERQGGRILDWECGYEGDRKVSRCVRYQQLAGRLKKKKAVVPVVAESAKPILG